MGQATGLSHVAYADLRVHAHVCANVSSTHTMCVVRTILAHNEGSHPCNATSSLLIRGKKRLT